MKRGLVVFFAISIVSVALLAALTFDSRTIDAVRQVSGSSIVLASLLIISALGLDAVRFALLARGISVRLSSWESIEAVLAGYFVAAVTPFSFGGGLMQIYLLRRRGGSTEAGVALCLVRAFMDVLVFLCGLMALIYMWLGGGLPQSMSWLRVAGVLVVAVVYVSLVALIARNPERAIARLRAKMGRWRGWSEGEGHSTRTSRLLGRSLARTRDLSEAVRHYWPNRKALVCVAGMLTLSITSLRFAIAPVLLVGLGVDVSFWDVFLLQFALAWLLYAVPTPGGSGAAEGGFAALLAFSVPASVLPVSVLMWRFFSNYLSVALGGLIVAARLGGIGPVRGGAP